jgi:extracellular elastinolytic metalloproteinase
MKYFYFLFLSLCFQNLVWASNDQIAKQYISNNLVKLHLKPYDIQDLRLASIDDDKSTGITHVYFQQFINGIKLENGIINIAIKNEKVIYISNSAIGNLEEKINQTRPTISAKEALLYFLKYRNLNDVSLNAKISNEGKMLKTVFNKTNISKNEIEVSLIYVNTKNKLQLAWEVQFEEINTPHVWHAKVSVVDGKIIAVDDYNVSCTFNHDHYKNHDAILPNTPKEDGGNEMNLVNVPNSYAVYPAPFESPNETNITVVTNPADATYSPFGWHDINGVAGNEYTITRGNNVFVAEDKNGDDNPGVSPNCGTNIECVFPIDLTQSPDVYQNAAMTNYFYWNNWIHDVLAYHGFTESAGNFQTRNYTGAAGANDQVNADWADGLNAAVPTLDNANFATYPDGQASRMQMFRFSASQPNFFTVMSPASIAGVYFSTYANWNTSQLPNPAVQAQVVLVQDNSTTPTLLCGTLTSASAASINGKIAMIDRGTCEFGAKALKAQTAGAIAVIICNNIDNAGPVQMGAGAQGGSVTIPVAMLSKEDCNIVKAQLSNNTVVKLQYDPNSPQIDGALDNGVVAHEYGHGVSNRLVGGRTNTSCLINQYQPGEGWSDYLAMWFTMKDNDSGTDKRGMGNYAFSEPVSSTIRHKMYTTDMDVNNLTLDNLMDAFDNPASANPTFKTGGQYYIGTLWCTMLWDMTWNLIDQHGFNTNQKGNTGGNIKAMKLILEGMKLQPCNASFVDMRDAILAADQALYGGENECMIWAAFARRGLGNFSETPDPNDAVNFLTDFELPTQCAYLGVENQMPLNRSLFGQLYYNNPAKQGDIIKFAPEESQNVSIQLISSEGKIVEHLYNGMMQAHDLKTFSISKPLSGGIYFLQINADKFKETRKIIFK